MQIQLFMYVVPYSLDLADMYLHWYLQPRGLRAPEGTCHDYHHPYLQQTPMLFAYDNTTYASHLYT